MQSVELDAGIKKGVIDVCVVMQEKVTAITLTLTLTL